MTVLLVSESSVPVSESVAPRRRRTVLVVVAAVVVAAAVGALVWAVLFRSDDGPSATAGASSATTASTSQVFSQAGTPFTFEYPGSFAAVGPGTLPTGYVAILGTSPVNFIDVRLTANVELADADVEQDMAAALETATVHVTGHGTQQRGAFTVVHFTVRDTSAASPTVSRLNFFHTQGRTWEIGCQSDEAGRAAIDAACDQALGSLASA